VINSDCLANSSRELIQISINIISGAFLFIVIKISDLNFLRTATRQKIIWKTRELFPFQGFSDRTKNRCIRVGHDKSDGGRWGGENLAQEKKAETCSYDVKRSKRLLRIFGKERQKSKRKKQNKTKQKKSRKKKKKQQQQQKDICVRKKNHPTQGEQEIFPQNKHSFLHYTYFYFYLNHFFT